MVDLRHFDFSLGCNLPERLTLRKEGFDAAFEAFTNKERDAGRRMTLDAFYTELGMDDRVMRRARKGVTTLPRHQVQAMVNRLGCKFRDLVEDPNADVKRRWDARDQREMAAWPVPLCEVPSWMCFTEHLRIADKVDWGFNDDVVDLATACALDAFVAALAYAKKMLPDHRAVAAATLKDATQDLAGHGLHVLFGRYVARRRPGPDTTTGGTELEYTLVVRIRRETEDPGFTIDRSAESPYTSDQEDFYGDDQALNDFWLEWEGKDRLSLWRNCPVSDA